MIRNMNHARFFAVIVASKEILLRSHTHVARGYGNIGIPAQIIGCIVALWNKLRWRLALWHPSPASFAIIYSVVPPLAQWKFAGGSFRVIGHVKNILREKRLVMLIHARRHIRPPEKRLHKLRAVVSPDFKFDVCFTRMQTNAMHSLHAGHRIVIAAPDGLAAVSVLFDLHIHRHKRRRAVVLRPVELHAARNPRPRQPNQRRFDHVLPVEKVVSVRLVLADMNAPSDLREDHYLKKFVLQMHGIPEAFRFCFRDPIVKGKRIDASAAALVNPLLQEHRVLVGRHRLEGRKGDRFTPNRNRKSGHWVQISVSPHWAEWTIH